MISAAIPNALPTLAIMTILVGIPKTPLVAGLVLATALAACEHRQARLVERVVARTRCIRSGHAC